MLIKECDVLTVAVNAPSEDAAEAIKSVHTLWKAYRHTKITKVILFVQLNARILKNELL